MEVEGFRVLAQAGVPAEVVTVARTADMRLYGQAHQISVPVPLGTLASQRAPELAAAFERAYTQLYKRTPPGVAVEAISWRVVVAGPRPSLTLSHPPASAAAALKHERPVYFPETGVTPTPVYDRYALAPGARFTGPAVIEERESTAVVGPGAQVHVDAQVNVVVTLR
jgi:N-methylhydantoinase A/oxoprolinase/acetone carboxylase beta subunit